MKSIISRIHASEHTWLVYLALAMICLFSGMALLLNAYIFTMFTPFLIPGYVTGVLLLAAFAFMGIASHSARAHAESISVVGMKVFYGDPPASCYCEEHVPSHGAIVKTVPVKGVYYGENLHTMHDALDRHGYRLQAQCFRPDDLASMDYLQTAANYYRSIGKDVVIVQYTCGLELYWQDVRTKQVAVDALTVHEPIRTDDAKLRSQGYVLQGFTRHWDHSLPVDGQFMSQAIEEYRKNGHDVEILSYSWGNDIFCRKRMPY